MSESINTFLSTVNDIVWGIPLILLILVGGIYLTVRTGMLQVFKLPLALKYTVKNEDGAEGEVSSFGSLCTALSATLGTGNIVSVATAISAGGPGALFWMIVAAFFGMATKYAEGLLAVKYRIVDENHHVLGGPFYYIEKGMGEKWIWLAKFFAFFGACAGLLGIGTFTQINGISTAAENFFDPNSENIVNIPFVGSYSVITIIVSVIITALVAFVIIGGIKRIVNVSQVVVPFMASIYILFTFTLLLCNLSELPHAIALVFEGAFNPSAVTGGIIGSMLIAMQKGVARGIFSNEAGLGSAPIASAAARTNEPVRQGLVSMTGTFLDTIVICNLTGLSIIVTDAWRQTGLEGVEITTYAFNKGLPLPEMLSSFFLMICLVFFAFTTILGWDYYSEKCLEYLTNNNLKAIKIFRFLYIACVFIGPFMTVSAVWTIADIFNGLMAFPNMIAIFALAGVVAVETKNYFRKDDE